MKNKIGCQEELSFYNNIKFSVSEPDLGVKLPSFGVVIDFGMSKGKPWHLSLSYPKGPHFAAVNKNNEIIVTDFHNHSVKVRTQWLYKMCMEAGTFFAKSSIVNFTFLAMLGFHPWRRVAIKVWFQWWRKWPIQCSDWCSCGHQWQHHRSRLGEQQNPGRWFIYYLELQVNVFQSISVCVDNHANLFFVIKPSGFWWKWLLLVLHQHISRSTVWTPRSGFDLRWPRSGGWFWQPLL